MPITTDDLQQILETAIITAQLAKPDVAPSLAATLAAPVANEINNLLEDSDALAPTSLVAPLMSVSDALTLRNAISATISSVPVTADSVDEISERLLLAGFIDIPALLHGVHVTGNTGLIQLPSTTGQHAAVGAAGQDV